MAGQAQRRHSCNNCLFPKSKHSLQEEEHYYVSWKEALAHGRRPWLMEGRSLSVMPGEGLGSEIPPYMGSSITAQIGT